MENGDGFLDLDPRLVGPGRFARAVLVTGARLDPSTTDALVSTAVVLPARLVVSASHLTAAVAAAALAAARGASAARSFHAEVLYRFSPCRRVGDALKKLGVQTLAPAPSASDPSSSSPSPLPPVVVAAFGTSPREAAENLERALGMLGVSAAALGGGSVEPLRGANPLADAFEVRKLYEITDAEAALPGDGSLLSSVLTRMAVKECSR